MTNAGFLERYQMLQQVGDGPVRSFHAMAGTGVVVMLHFLEGSEEANNALLALVDRLKPTERKRVLDVTAVDGKPVIVTRFILDFRSLEQWLRTHQMKDAPAADAETPQAAPPIQTTSTFNAVFPPTPAPPVTSAPAPSPATPAEAEPLPPPAAKTPGDFTLMFATPEQLPEAPRKEPSEFTREFSVPKELQPAPPPPSVTLQPPSSTGEFTGVFRAELPGKPMGGSSPPTQPPFAPPVAPPVPPAPAPPSVPDASEQPPAAGDFTRMFRADLLNPRPAEPTPPPPSFSAPASSAGSATSSFEAPPPVVPPAVPPQLPTSDTGFTQLFSAPTPEKRYTAPSFGGPADPPKANVPTDNYLSRLGSSGPGPSSPSGPPAFEPNWGTPPPPAASPLPPPGHAYVPPPIVPPPSQVGPSEYTRVISQPGFDPRSLMAPGGHAPPPPPSAAPVSASPKTPKIVIIGLIAVIVIAVATILFFVLK